MKKLFSLIVFVCAVFCCTISAFAAKTTYQTAADLYDAWGDRFPDYVCGIWNPVGSGNHIMIGIQNNAAGNAGKKEILDLIEDDSTVSFVYQTYTRKELFQIQGKLEKQLNEKIGIISASVSEEDNCVVLGVDKEKQGNHDTEEQVAALQKQYGNAIRVEYHDNTTELYTEQDHSGFMPVFYGLAAVFILLLFGSFTVAQRRGSRAALQTSGGKTMTTSVRLSRKETENMISKSEIIPPADLEQKMIQKLNHAEAADDEKN